MTSKKKLPTISDLSLPSHPPSKTLVYSLTRKGGQWKKIYLFTMFGRSAIQIAKRSIHTSRDLCLGLTQSTQKGPAMTLAATSIPALSNGASLAGLRRTYFSNSHSSSSSGNNNKPKKKTNQWDLPVIEGVEAESTTLASSEPKMKEPDREELLERQKLEEKRKEFKSRLDEKAVNILKKRPELQEKIEEMLVEYDPEKGKSIVPKGWRKDKNLADWQRQNFALKEKLDGQKWRPRKGLSREAIEGIRALKQYSPELHSGDFARMFKVPTESIRRILKSSWEPTPEELEKINQRWERRGDRIITSLKKKAWEEKQVKIKESEARLREQNIVREARGLPLLSPDHLNKPKKGNKFDYRANNTQKNRKRYNRKNGDDDEFKPDRSVSKMIF